MQILANLYGCPLEIPQHAESSTAIGAAVIAGVGVGLYEGFHIAKRIARAEKHVEPQQESIAVYRALRARYTELLVAVTPLFGSTG